MERGSYSQRHGRKPETTTEMLVELVFRRLRDFKQRDYFYEAFTSYEDPWNQFHEARLPNPEEYVIAQLGRPGLWRWLGRLDDVVRNEDFPAWDEDTLFDVIELFYDKVVSAPLFDADGAFEGYSQEMGREHFRKEMNDVLRRRSPPAELGEDGQIRAPSPPEQAGRSDVRDGRDGYDVFISHASEDKAAIARPLADALQARGYRVFLDERVLRAGDSLRRELDRGLAEARRGVVILSPAFFAKEWPQRELDAMTAREASSRGSLIIPIWHGVGAADVERYSPTLADRLAVDSGRGLDAVVDAVERALDRSSSPPRDGDRRSGAAAPGSQRGRRPRIPLARWLSRHERIRIWEWIAIGIVAAVASGLIARPLVDDEDGPPDGERAAERVLWRGAVQAAVRRADGAAVRDRVDLATGSVIDRLPPGATLEFGGYCLGAETSDVLTGTPDILWYRLRGTENYIASGVVDGLPPASVQPERCLGDQPGPRELSVARDGNRLEAAAPDAPLVGFAFLMRGARSWRALPLDLDASDGFSIRAPTGWGVVLAASCWAVGAPAHPEAPGRYLTDHVVKGRPGERTSDRASASFAEGAAAACGPDAYDEARRR
jgi:hypothetical protein